MSLLSMIAQSAIDYTWLLPILSTFLFWWFSRIMHDTDDIKEEGVIDLYHHLSRRLYCTAETFRILSDEEAQRIDDARFKTKTAIEGRFVNHEEGNKANVWGPHHQPTTVYGQSYFIV